MNINKLCILLTCTLFSVSVEASEKVYRIIAFKDGAGDIMSQRLIKKVYAKAGLKMKVVNYPGHRALLEANSGRADALLSRRKIILKKFTNLIAVSPALHEMKIQAFVTDKKFKVQGWKSLAPYKIILVRGQRGAINATKGMDVELTTNSTGAFKMLSKQRRDVYATTQINGIKYISELGLKNVKALPEPITTIKMHHIVHKKNKGLVDRLSKAIQELHESGEAKKIEDDFFSELQKK